MSAFHTCYPETASYDGPLLYVSTKDPLFTALSRYNVMGYGLECDSGGAVLAAHAQCWNGTLPELKKRTVSKGGMSGGLNLEQPRSVSEAYYELCRWKTAS